MTEKACIWRMPREDETVIVQYIEGDKHGETASRAITGLARVFFPEATREGFVPDNSNLAEINLGGGSAKPLPISSGLELGSKVVHERVTTLFAAADTPLL